MEGASVSVGTEELDAALQEYWKRGKNTREVMADAALLLVEEVDDNFETSGHGKWEPFSENTRRARGDMDAAKLLMDTGRLAASITPYSDNTTAEAFTNVEYAKFHVSDKPRHVIPLRDFFDIDTPRVVEEVIEMVLKEITQ